MKKRNKVIDNLIWVAAILLVAVIAIVVVLFVVKRSRNTVNDTASQVFDLISEESNILKNMYDGNDVQGSQVIEAINKYATADLTVNVVTKMNTAGKAYNAAYTDPGVTNNDHINERASFSSAVTVNANGEVTAITFTQK